MLRKALLPACLLLLACCLVGAPAAAEEQKKRALPDYDNRGGPYQSPGRRALWVPRLVLSPVYFVTEYLVRRPLGYVLTAAEKAQVPRVLYDFFAFGPDHKAGIVPIAFLDFGIHPSVGLYLFWDDAGFEGHDLRLRGSTGGPDWLSGTVTDRVRLSKVWDVTLTGTATHRPDYSFFGIGYDSREENLMYYASDSLDGRLESRLTFGYSLIEAGIGYSGVSFGDTQYQKTSIHDSVVGGAIEAPPGFDDGYKGPYVQGRLALDSRRPTVTSQTGVRAELLGRRGSDLQNEPNSGWLRWATALSGYVDLGDSGRVLGLTVMTAFAEPLGDRPVPFTELVQLGGASAMPGFRTGRLFDSSAAVATLSYTWPVWIWLNGSLQAAFGNVYGEHLEDFSVGHSRFSTALGINSGSSRDSVFQALVGFGTETFDSGAAINSIRVEIGSRSAF